MLLLCICIGLLGFLPFVIVLWRRIKSDKLRKEGDIVTGEVLEIKQYIGFKGAVFYKALIEYPVFGKGKVQNYFPFTATRGQTFLSVGQKVELYYDKIKPNKFLVKATPKNNFLLIFTIILAIGYVVLCFFLYDFIKDQNFHYK